MKAELKNGNLIVTIPTQEPTVSTSGKSKIVASSHGNQPTTVEIEGKALVIGLNAYIKV